MSNVLKPAASLTADLLPIYRVYRGHRTAERLRTDMHDPADRTWTFAGRVLMDACTDRIDGELARYAGPTGLGSYIDQLADKAWFLQIARQLVKNGEIDSLNFTLPAVRDLGILAGRHIGHYYGANTDAKAWSKLKMGSQTGAAVAACSPLAAEYPALVETLFEVATTASIASGLDTLVSYASEISARHRDQPAAQAVVATTRLLLAS